MPNHTFHAVLLVNLLGLVFHPTNFLSAQTIAAPSPGSSTLDSESESPSQSRSQATQEPQPTFTSDTQGWKLIRPSGADAEVKMPVKPRYIERSFTPVENQPPIKVHLHLASFNQGQAATVFSYHDLNEMPATSKVADETLTGAVAGSIANVFGKPVSQQKIRYKSYPGREFVYMYAQSDKIFKVSARVFLVGQRQYQISLLMDNEHYDEAMATAYLNTFRLFESDSDLPPRPPARQQP